MIRKLRNLSTIAVPQIIERLASRLYAGIICILFLIVAVLINGRPYGVSELEAITGGIGIPDMNLSYTPESLYSLLNSLGPAGRDFYLTHIIPADMVFPFLYSVVYAIVLWYLLRAWNPENRAWSGLICLPLIGGLADYLENICFLIILLNYPAIISPIAQIAAIFTGIKWIFNILSIGVIIVLLAGILLKVIMNRNDLNIR